MASIYTHKCGSNEYLNTTNNIWCTGVGGRLEKERGYLGCIWGSIKLTRPQCVIVDSESLPKKCAGLEIGKKKYIRINQVLLSLKGGIRMDAEQAFYTLKSGKNKISLPCLGPHGHLFAIVFLS